MSMKDYICVYLWYEFIVRALGLRWISELHKDLHCMGYSQRIILFVDMKKQASKKAN